MDSFPQELADAKSSIKEQCFELHRLQKENAELQNVVELHKAQVCKYMDEKLTVT